MLRLFSADDSTMMTSAPRRLQNRDYSLPGLYFVTICADFKRCIFGRINNAKVELSALGQIAEECWLELPNHFGGVRLVTHIVMPNHIHGIIEIYCDKVPQERSSGRRGMSSVSSLSIMIRSFKAEVTRRARLKLSLTGNVWQHNYYDRVIRDRRELSNAERYIAENPLRWQNQGAKMAASGKAKSKRLAQHAAPLQRVQI